MRCVHCGREFSPRRSDGRYCSAVCGARAWRARMRALRESVGASRGSRRCPGCGGPLAGRRKDAVYCSDRCSKAHRRRVGTLVRALSGLPAPRMKSAAESEEPAVRSNDALAVNVVRVAEEGS